MQYTFKTGYAIPSEFLIEVKLEKNTPDTLANVRVKVNGDTFTCQFESIGASDDFTEEEKSGAELFVRDNILNGTITLPAFVPFDDIISIDYYEAHEVTSE